MRNAESRGSKSVGALRMLSTWACFVLGLALSLLLVRVTINRLQLDPQVTDVGFYELVLRWKSDYAEVDRTSGEAIAITGGSMLMLAAHLADEGIYPLPERLEHELRSLAPEREIALVPLRWGGYGLLENYFLADEIASTGVRRIVVSLNLRSLGPAWTRVWTRPGLAGWIALERIPHSLILPLYIADLTADRQLLYVFLKNVLGFDSWRWISAEQSRATSLPKVLSESTDRWLKLEARQAFIGAIGRERQIRLKTRASLEGVLHEYGPILSGLDADYPVLRVLAATLRTWRKAGAEVLVVVMPTNLEHWQSLGIATRGRRIRKSVETIEAVVRSNGGIFLDLHDLLGKEGFRDVAGHLTYTGEVDGDERVVRRLAPALLDAFPAIPREPF